MTFEEAQKVHTGMPLRDLSTNEVFIVLCNCAKSEPRRHTQRYVAANPESFEMVHFETGETNVQ